MIQFHLDARSGVSPYQQLVHQVRHALRLGMLEQGYQLPTVKDVVADLAINPNTVLKAYRELEHEGLVSARPGVGTFVTAQPNPVSVFFLALFWALAGGLGAAFFWASRHQARWQVVQEAGAAGEVPDENP